MPKKFELNCYFGCIIDGPLHRFPKWVHPYEDKFNNWKGVLSSVTQEKGNEYIYNNIRICYRHFEKYYQLPSHQLTRNAVPTLNLNSFDYMQEQDSTSALTDDHLQRQVLTAPTEKCSASIQYDDSTHEKKIQVARKTSRSLPKLCTLKYKTRAYARKIEVLENKIVKLRQKFKSRLSNIQMANKISRSKSFTTVLEKLPEPIKIFTALQLKHSKRPRGRKYSMKEKILSLTILKQSPKAYNLLRKLFVLPSKRTLQKLLSCVVIKPGINKHILEHLKLSVRKVPQEKRLCSLIFDEVALAPGVYYNNFFKEIIGFEDFGYKKSTKIADHALVIMIKSIKGKFKQPVCFTFCQSATKKQDLKIIIKECVKDITATGLTIICTVCDQSSTNMSTIKTLHEDTKEVYVRRGEEYKSFAFEIDNIKVFPLFDPPHLLKGIRNNLLMKNLRYIENEVVKLAKWEHIITFIEKDVEDNDLRLVNKITELHYKKEKIPKMKVKYAAQIFSQRLSAAIKFCTRHEILPKECSDTSDLLYIFDQLFDSFNGQSYKYEGKKFRVCLKNNSPHFELWNKLLPILRSMGFETKKKDGTTTYQKVPSINNFIHNINVYKEMWTYLNQNHNITSLLPRNINQDPIENFFCKIRSNGVRNVNPTCDQFINAYKTLLINNFTAPHSVNANCEDDDSRLLQTMEIFLLKETCAEKSSSAKDCAMAIDSLIEDLCNPSQSSQNIIHNETKKYVSGWVLKKVKSKVFKSCPVCTEGLLSQGLLDSGSYIYERDYTKKSLMYPSHDFKNLMADIFYIIEKCIQDSPECRFLEEKIIFNANIYCNFNIINKCEAHALTLKNHIMKISINLILHSWCTGVNRILKGKLTKFNENDAIKVQAYMYHKTNMKNKK